MRSVPSLTTCFVELYPAQYKARQRGQPNERVKFVPVRTQGASTSARAADAPFGQRRAQSQSKKTEKKSADEHIVRNADGTVEMSWVPSSGGGKGKRRSSGFDDMDVDTEGSGRGRGKIKEKDTRKGVERFGAGMEKGGEAPADGKMSEAERRGRTHRRKDVRSGSKNTFRRI